MLDILEKRSDFASAKKRAAELSIKDERVKYVGYVARNDIFKISDWHDDSTLCSFYNGEETSY